MAHDQYEIKKLKENNLELIAEVQRLNNEPAGISWAPAPQQVVTVKSSPPAPAVQLRSAYNNFGAATFSAPRS